MYTWDAANRLTAVGGQPSAVSFEYNGLGQRTEQTVAGVTTEYALDTAGGLPQVIAATASGATTQYVQVQGQILAQYDSGTWGYVLPDHLGSVRTEMDALGQVTVARSFDPFGVPLGADGGSPFGYTGEQWDAGTELVFLRARYYDPYLNRFISPDTIIPDFRDPQSLNRYTYVLGNPVNCVDPSGLTPVPWGVGTKYMYSCRCGWIDWGGHGKPKTRLINRLKNAIDAAETSFVWIDSIGSIPGSRVVIYKPAAQPDHNLLAIALGIYISASNIFEEVIQGGSGNLGHAQSSFSNEDLVSNLIGFHRGVRNYKSNPSNPDLDYDDEASRKYYMDLCDVVGYEYYKPGRIDEFIRIQKAVYRDMVWKGEMPVPFVGRQTMWGVRPPNQWSGSVVPAGSCLSVGCSGSDHLPVQLIAITPKPPLDGWAWDSTSLVDTRLPAPGRGGALPYDPSSIPDFSDPDYLNSRPLNWAPSGQ